MVNFKSRFRVFCKTHWQLAAVLLLLLLAFLLLWFSRTNSNQAVGAVAAQVYFEGEYRIADGECIRLYKGSRGL